MSPRQTDRKTKKKSLNVFAANPGNGKPLSTPSLSVPEKRVFFLFVLLPFLWIML
jgi:hypothetical protein